MTDNVYQYPSAYIDSSLREDCCPAEFCSACLRSSLLGSEQTPLKERETLRWRLWFRRFNEDAPPRDKRKQIGGRRDLVAPVPSMGRSVLQLKMPSAGKMCVLCTIAHTQ
jgi:hypothetical protein